MKNGIIYKIVSSLITWLKYINLVELFKFIGRKITRGRINSTKIITANRISTDIFIISKWVVLIILWYLHFSSPVTIFLVWYLILTNIFTYFYYHIWDNESLNSTNFDIDRVKRRFLNLMLAVAFSTCCFAYLFKIPYASNFGWKNGIPTSLNSLMYSFSNSLAANYTDVKPLTDFGNMISLIQLLFTFIFVTIILSKSIPQANQKV